MQSGEPTLLIDIDGCIRVSEIDDVKDINFFINRVINLKSGTSFTIFTYGYMIPEAVKAAEILEEKGISIDLFITVDLSKIDTSIIQESAIKTKHFLSIDCFTTKCSVAKDVLSDVLLDNECRESLSSFKVLGIREGSESTSFFKTRDRYINYKNLVNYVLETLNKKKIIFEDKEYHDIPGEWFMGPF